MSKSCWMCQDCCVHLRGSEKAVVCTTRPWGAEIWVRCTSQPQNQWSQVATSNRRPCPWPRVLPPLEGSCLRSSQVHWDKLRQSPKKPCWAPARAYPQSRGQGRGDLPAPDALPHWPQFAFCRFSILVDLCFYFRERHVSSLSVSNS